MEKNEYFQYLNDDHKDTRLESIEEYAKIEHVPIIQKEGLDFILQIMKLANVKKILEIGSAIGYSAINFALMNHDITVVTIERDPKMIAEAKKNIADFLLNERINLITGDALEIELSNDEMFDLLFIDAAKSQYQKFFEKYTPYLKKGGIVVTDNLIFHDLLFEDNIQNKNTRQLVNKIKNYNEWLKNNTDFDTKFFPLGDGIAISIKK